eukprot:bmy_17175T0
MASKQNFRVCRGSPGRISSLQPKLDFLASACGWQRSELLHVSPCGLASSVLRLTLHIHQLSCTRKLRASSRSCGDASTEGWKMNCTLPSCREASIIPLFCDKSRFLTRCFHRLSLPPHGTILFIHLCFIFAIKKKIIPALISAPFMFFECF